VHLAPAATLGAASGAGHGDGPLRRDAVMLNPMPVIRHVTVFGMRWYCPSGGANSGYFRKCVAGALQVLPTDSRF